MIKELKIQHPRLAAFFDNSVLNGVIILWALLWFVYTLYPAMILPIGLIFLTLLLIFIGYTLWFWIKAPSKVMVNEKLSDINGIMILYLLLVSAINTAGRWWYILGIIGIIGTLFILLNPGNNKEIDLKN